MPRLAALAFPNVERAAVGGAVIRDRYRSEFAKPCSGQQGAPDQLPKILFGCVDQALGLRDAKMPHPRQVGVFERLHGTPRRV